MVGVCMGICVCACRLWVMGYGYGSRVMGDVGLMTGCARNHMRAGGCGWVAGVRCARVRAGVSCVRASRVCACGYARARAGAMVQR